MVPEPTPYAAEEGWVYGRAHFPLPIVVVAPCALPRTDLGSRARLLTSGPTRACFGEG
jgi:hypothetical protein